MAFPSIFQMRQTIMDVAAKARRSEGLRKKAKARGAFTPSAYWNSCSHGPKKRPSRNATVPVTKSKSLAQYHRSSTLKVGLTNADARATKARDNCQQEQLLCLAVHCCSSPSTTRVTHSTALFYGISALAIPFDLASVCTSGRQRHCRVDGQAPTRSPSHQEQPGGRMNPQPCYNPAPVSHSGRRIMAITLASQAKDVGSIPIARSTSD